MIECYDSKFNHHSRNSDFDYDKVLKYFQYFKEQINVINGEYLSLHLKGVVHHGWLRKRNPDNDVYIKSYLAKLDDEASLFCGIDSNNGFICVNGTSFRDKYVTDLLYTFEEDYNDELYTPDDETRCLNSLKEWKIRIKDIYNTTEHIIRLVNQLPEYFKNENLIEMLAKDFFAEYNINFKEFDSHGLHLEKLDYKNKLYLTEYNTVRVKRIHGLLGAYAAYGFGNKTPILPNENIVTIPSRIYSFGRGEFEITEIGEGVFENLSETKKLILPYTLNRITWSFWQCRNLECIEISEPPSPYLKTYFKSIDGVLYNADGTELLAYPNMHGIKYEIPKGVKRIGNKAFKDCINLEELILPSTLESIGINAFYRCENLKRIIVNNKKGTIKVEKLIGAYGNVNPQWYWLD